LSVEGDILAADLFDLGRDPDELFGLVVQLLAAGR
jgi:hypothetical protein